MAEKYKNENLKMIVFVGYYKSYSLKFLEMLKDTDIFAYKNSADGLIVGTIFSIN